MKKLLAWLSENRVFLLAATIAALALRSFFLYKFSHVAGDSLIYGDIAKNWLQHGIYGLTDLDAVRPTLIRLPGYPAFLAAVFAIFGMEHYTAAMVVQVLVDINTCLVVAALALELFGARAAKAAYLVAALCPFTAVYVATPLSETLSIFCTAHALYYGVRSLRELEAEKNAGSLWAITGFWTAAAIMFRPDNGILLAAFLLALIVLAVRSHARHRVAMATMLLFAVSLAPLLPWTYRNWRVFHVLQPLAPRYANDPGEFVPNGWDHWVKTWLVDFVSVEEVYWKVDGEPLDIHTLPERAFDTRPQYDKTAALIEQYNAQLHIDAELDQGFEQLARQRIARNPFRYGIWLPTLRIADMWLRPRTEMFPIETRWWEFGQHEGESWFTLAWAALNAAFLVAALIGWRRSKLGTAGVLLVGFVILRSLFLSTLENPEPRYVLECYPVVLVLCAALWAPRTRARLIRKQQP